MHIDSSNFAFELSINATQAAYNQKCYLDGVLIEFEHEYTYKYYING